jgi:hypothetical protein
MILISASRAQTLASAPIAEFPPFKVIQGNVDSDANIGGEAVPSEVDGLLLSNAV